MDDYEQNKQAALIKRSMMSFDEIDDEQAKYIQILISSWRKTMLYPGNVISFLEEVSRGSITEFDTKRIDPDEQGFWHSLKGSEEGYREGILAPETQGDVHNALSDVESRLVECEIDSWGAMIAIAEIVYAHVPPKDKDYWDLTDQEKSINDFYLRIQKDKKYWKDREDRRNVDILDEMKPDKEEDIRNHARECLAAMKDGSSSSFENFMSGAKNVSDLYDYDVGGLPSLDEKISDLDEKVQETLFPGGREAIWGDWAKLGPLCNEMHIAPSGAGLISIDVCNDGVHDFYGVKVARISTYSVSLKVADWNKMTQVARIVEIALGAIAHFSPTREFAGGGVGNEDYTSPGPYVKEDDDMIMIEERMSLDDLWVFYYMIEPILASNKQISTAMNMARYAEERGAPLDPDAVYISTQQHDVAHNVHTLKDDEHALPLALKNAFYDVTIGRINQGQFLSRLGVLSDHSLQGTILDSKQLLPTYEQIMIADKSSDVAGGQSRELTNYEQAMKNRIYDFIRVLTGNYDDKTPLALSLTQTINRYGPIFKQQELEKEIALAKSNDQKVKAQRRRDEDEYTSGATAFNAMIGEDDIFDGGDLSNAFDELRGYKKRGRSTVNDKNGHGESEETTDLVSESPGQLALRDSDVEACLDEMHYLGQVSDQFDDAYQQCYYRSKTKGSMYPRKELPTKLKPFSNNGNDPRKGFNALTFKPL